MTINEKIQAIGIIPVVVLDEAKDAAALGNVLCRGGLPAAEVTFRTDAAEESIRIMSRECPDLFVGAGTVLNVLQAERAVDAGAKFIVSPGFSEDVVSWCLDRDIPVFPGTVTPTEMTKAVEYGLSVVKFFPAEPAGGLKYIKACAAPFTGLKFMPTGGINEKNVRDYLSYDRIIACGGSWMVKKDMIKEGRFEEIEKLVREAAEIVKSVR
ncbi:MAG: bifunctional 4-hydroxy-2-oxoglutarate aldolase/2-dehydro-3-deoxy-phosphogluconate aldolase [Lachnospiraceae bacterium]|nr:bifunctional 4-hydroxy-2-oxoglutarate aldolase/2-dehydro-3-deoxy-phosphogluconate aldolase [Lachnospiraceae bacterium]